MVFYFNGSRVERLGEPVLLQPQGQRVKRYRLERRLGQGGMGVVYAAWDEKEERRVALKSIKLDEMDEDGEMLRRFKNEAKNVARLNHPNIVHIYSEDGLDLEQINRVIMPYMVMEYAEGGDLQERLKALGAERLYPLKRTLHLFEQLCYAIEHMHQRNIIHRDLKPSNVLFKSADKENDELMLGDFGLSIHEDASLISYPTAGTPAYRAPEQAFGEAKKESDIFSLGILLYQLCTGRFPFNPYGRTYPPARPSSVNSALPLALDAVLLKALHEHPGQRFGTASEFLAQVRSAIIDVPMPAPLARSSALSQSNAIYPTARPNIIEFVAKPTKAIAPVPSPAVADFNSVEPSNAAKVDYARGKAGIGIPHHTFVGRAKTQHKYPRSHNGRLLFLLSGLLLLALLLSYIGFAYLQPTSFARVIHAFSPTFTGVATVTIVPDNRTVAHSYIISAVTGTPDPSQRQVKAFPLSDTPTAKSATVAATGRKDTVASPATGTLSFVNGGGAPYTFSTTIPIRSSSGIVVFLDAPVTVPAADPVAGTFGKATGTATTSTTGANTNIPAGGINTSASGNVVVIMNNKTFTGGQDDAHYNFVQPAPTIVTGNG